ncbi:hypothetical protein ACWKSP_05895 [Micromonosporaceae bacterium Da 78-11]
MRKILITAATVLVAALGMTVNQSAGDIDWPIAPAGAEAATAMGNDIDWPIAPADPVAPVGALDDIDWP